MTIVTKKGDAGMTGLANGEPVLKSDPRVDTYGTLDELVSFLGLVRATDIDATISSHIKNIQCNLFLLGTELAGGKKFAEPGACYYKKERKFMDTGLGEEHLKNIEDLISEYERRMSEPSGFTIPGDSWPSALMDVSRAVCRRFERRLVALKDSGNFSNEVALKYVNRLSDLLYIFARHV